MPSTVYFSDMRTSKEGNLFDKIGKLMEKSGLAGFVSSGDLVAVKIHFGEKGNHAFVRPIFIRRVVEEIKKCGGLPFLTDSSTLYPGERKNAVAALTCAVENGFAYAVVGAPLIMCDGLRGQSAVEVPIAGEIFERVKIASEIIEADSLVAVSHFKCHELTGFGGASEKPRDGMLESGRKTAAAFHAGSGCEWGLVYCLWGLPQGLRSWRNCCYLRSCLH